MLKYKEEERRKILEKYKRTTDSQYEFCRKNNINRSTLRGWLRTEEKNATKTDNEKIDFGVIQIESPKEDETKAEDTNAVTISCTSIKIEAKKYNTEVLEKLMEVLTNVK